MNTQSTRNRFYRAAALVAAVAVIAVMASATVASAQPAGDRGPWERLDLTPEQRAKVREIVKEHREASREELHQKLATVLTDEQMEQLDKMGPRGRKQSMWDNRPGRPGRPGRREDAFRRYDKMRGGKHGHHRGCGDCDCGGQGRGGRGHGGMHRGGMRGGGMGGPGPHMGEFREERAERMVDRLAVVLDLTKEQKEKVAHIVQEHQSQFKDFDRSGLSFEERQQTRDAHRMLLSNRIKEVLTDKQIEKYDEFMKTMPGPRGGRGHGNRN